MAFTADAQTVLLCHFDGADNSTTFVDSSTSAKTLTAFSNAKLSTAQSAFGGASLVLTGALGHVYAPDSADWEFPGRFTIEGWFRFTGGVTNQILVSQWGANLGNMNFLFHIAAGNLTWRMYENGTANERIVSAAWTPALNTWYHLAVDRDASNVLRIYVNGAVHASATGYTYAGWASASALTIGREPTNSTWSGHDYAGYIDELRISKGIARYGGAFTPPAIEAAVEPVRVRKLHGFAVLSPPPSSVAVQKAHAYAVLDDGSVPAFDPHWSNTVLLCHFDGAAFSSSIIDSSPSAHAMTAHVAAISTTTPKFGGASLDVATSWSSGNYVTTNDKLTDFQFGAGPFTIESWVRFRTVDFGQQHVVCAASWNAGNLGWKFGFTASGGLRFIYSVDGITDTSVEGAVTPSTGVWHHVAVDRDASNMIRVYFNGAVLASGAAPVSLNPGAYAFYVGNDPAHNRAVNGWLDDLRITKGAARYGGAFAVPQAAFPDTGTSPVVVTARRRPVVAFLG